MVRMVTLHGSRTDGAAAQYHTPTSLPNPQRVALGRWSIDPALACWIKRRVLAAHLVLVCGIIDPVSI
jgi:hypothetical protein